VKATKEGGKFIVLSTPPEREDTKKLIADKNITMVIADTIRYFRETKECGTEFINKKKILGKGLEVANELYLSGAVRPVISRAVNATVDELKPAMQELKDGKQPPGKTGVNVKKLSKPNVT
jgi:hypothetical protein